MTKALIKANDDLVSWCKCAEPGWATTGQADCPWCGCGWLFTCTTCRKAFTYAKVVETEMSYEEIVRADLEPHYGKDEIDPEDLEWHVQWLSGELRDLCVGELVVILDGKIMPADARNIDFTGWFARHTLEVVPQTAAGGSIQKVNQLLTMEYWLEREIKGEDGLR